jgi:hypothetical protein
MKTPNYYLIPVYILILCIVIVGCIYSHYNNKNEAETAAKMAEQGYEQVIEKPEGFSPKILWRKALNKAEK